MRGSRDRGDRQWTPPAMAMPMGPATTRSNGGNASNPTIGSGMQQARKSSGTLNGAGKPGFSPGDRRRNPTRPCETVRSERDASGSSGPKRWQHRGKADAGDEVDEGERANRPTNPKGGGRKTTDRGRWIGVDSDVVPIGRGAKPTRAGLRSTTARWRAGDGFRAGNLEGPAGRPARTDEARGRQTTRYRTEPWSPTSSA
jgi:hypothetical protein